MEERYLKLKKKDIKRLEKLMWKKAEQADALPMDTLMSLENALLYLRYYRSLSKRSRTTSK